MSITSLQNFVFNAKSVARTNNERKKTFTSAKKNQRKKKKKYGKKIIKAYVNEKMFSLWKIVFWCVLFAV